MLATRFLACLVVLSCLNAAPLAAQDKPAPPDLAQLEAAWQDKEAKPAARYRTALRIGSLATTKATRFLIKQLEGEKDATLRGYLVRGLVRAARADGVATVLIQLAEDPSEPYSPRSAAIEGLRDLEIDWLGWYQRFLARSPDTRYHATIVRASARGGDDAAWTALEALDDQGPVALRAAVTRYGARYFDLERFFPRFVRPHLKRRTLPTLRSAALQVLGDAKDARFLSEIDRIKVDETPVGSRAAWIRLAARFDDPKGLDRIRDLVGEGPSYLHDALYTAAFEMKHPEVRAWFREKAVKRKEPHWRRAAIENMKGTPAAENLKPLLRIIRKSDDVTVAAAVQALALQPRETVEEPLRELRRAKDLHLAAEAMEAHYRLAKDDPAITAELAEIALKSRKWQLRVAAMEILMRRNAAAMRPALERNVAHEKAPVRSVAYEAFTWLRDRESVDFIIARLEHEEGRTLFEASEALTDLTDFHWGTNQDRWKSWWGKVREGYPLPPKKTTAKKKKNSGAVAPRYASRFYGLDIDSKRVAFVIDTSGSMTARSNGSSGSTRIEQAKRELASAIGGFKTDQRFQIIAFNQGQRRYGKRLVKATKRERKKATDWISKLTAGGGTNVYDSLVEALELDDVDTIYLLSDGGPSAGSIIDPDAIRVAIRRHNRFLRVNINTIGIGVQGTTETFLRELAKENWGESIVLD